MFFVLCGLSFKRSKQGQRLHLLSSDFLYLSQHLVLQPFGAKDLRRAFCSFLSAFFRFFSSFSALLFPNRFCLTIKSKISYFESIQIRGCVKVLFLKPHGDPQGTWAKIKIPAHILGLIIEFFIVLGIQVTVYGLNRKNTDCHTDGHIAQPVLSVPYP